jgi:hypothetical protein
MLYEYAQPESCHYLSVRVPKVSKNHTITTFPPGHEHFYKWAISKIMSE